MRGKGPRRCPSFSVSECRPLLDAVCDGAALLMNGLVLSYVTRVFADVCAQPTQYTEEDYVVPNEEP